MQTETPAQSTITPEALKAEAARLVAAACERNGLKPDQITPEQAQAAVEHAKKNLEAKAAAEAEEAKRGPYRALFEEQVAQNKALQAMLDAVKSQARTNADNRDAKPVVTAEAARRRMGDLHWSKLTPDGRVQALGVDPRTVDVAELKATFGRGCDHMRASTLMKVSPARYRQMKEVAIALGVFAN